METILIIIGGILVIIGIIGCVVPALPGPPLAYGGLFLLQFAEPTPFSTFSMGIWALVVLAVTLLDYYVPIWGTQKFGGSKYGTYGSIVGLILGMALGPLGVIFGPFAGAVIGELIGGMSGRKALRAGFGAFVGFLAGTIMKLGVSLGLAIYFVKGVLEVL